MKSRHLALALLLASGCSHPPEEPVQPDTGAGAGNGGAAGTAPGAGSGGVSAGGTGLAGSAGIHPISHPCNEAKDLPGPAMVAITIPDGGQFCIDSSEVTRGHYAAFLKAKNGDTSGQIAPCTWNQAYEPKALPPNPPGQKQPGCGDTDWLSPATPDAPVVCIDWCDAKAYCAWAGKRLCGRIGGGALSAEGWMDSQDGSAPESKDPGLSQWTMACSQGGESRYAYGNEYQPATCVDDEYKSKNNMKKEKNPPVMSAPGCCGAQQPFSEIYDLIGSVSEFEDAVSLEAKAVILRSIVGGGVGQGGATQDCYSNIAIDIAASDATFGFRCCLD